jgi:putative oxygen-independent coproporphyrinogen III oxidase
MRNKICVGNFHSCPLPLSLYIHIPWCISKCPYCDFNSYAIDESVSEQVYLEALIADLRYDLSEIYCREIMSIFIGGGTPTLFAASTVARLLEKIFQLVPMKNDLEVTIEANPGTVSWSKLKMLRSAGVNRLSFGVQSFQNEKLKAIGRIHNKQDILTAIDLAIKADFANINLDLMYGLPKQTVDDALHDINIAASLNPTHLSWYQLSIEPNTNFYRNAPVLPDEDSIFIIQTNGQQLLNECGYERYEISAYSKPTWQCRHNLNYWQFGDYLGIGAGAHSKITDTVNNTVLRINKYCSPKIYLQQTGFIAEINKISANELVLEFMMNALRLCQPIPLTMFTERTGISQKVLDRPLAQAKNNGFIERDGSYIKTTELGRNFLNDLIQIFT